MFLFKRVLKISFFIFIILLVGQVKVRERTLGEGLVIGLKVLWETARDKLVDSKLLAGDNMPDFIRRIVNENGRIAKKEKLTPPKPETKSEVKPETKSKPKESEAFSEQDRQAVVTILGKD